MAKGENTKGENSHISSFSKKQKGTAKTTKPRLDAQRYREPLSANEVSFLNASMRLEKSRVLQRWVFNTRVHRAYASVLRSPSSSKTGCDNDDFAGMLPELETLQLQDASVQNSQPVDEVLLKMGSLDLAP